MLSEQPSFKLINCCEGDDQDFINKQVRFLPFSSVRLELTSRNLTEI
jgi:hypothetical protein